MPDVSVIIPAYNAAPFLSEAINSVFIQSGLDMEVIVVDDGSTDNTKEIATSFGNRVTYFHTPNSGPAAARNLGIAKSSGKFIAFLDADDWWLSGKLQTQIETLSRDSAISFVCSDWFNGKTGEEPRISVLSDYKALRQKTGFELMLEENFVNTSTVVVEREKLQLAGLFMESLRGAEDRHLWLRLLSIGDAHVCNDILTFRRFHPDNTSSTLPFVESQVKMMEDVLSWPSVRSSASRLSLANMRHNTLRITLACKLSNMGRYHEAADVYHQLWRESITPYQSLKRYLGYTFLGILSGIGIFSKKK